MAEGKCTKCGTCCTVMEFGPIQFKSDRPEFISGSIKWAENHGKPGRYTFEKRKDGWYFIIRDKCRKLGARNNCLDQENKPLPCREYKCKKMGKVE